MANRFTISTVFKGVDNMTEPVRKMTGSIHKMTESTEAGLRKIDAATSKVTEGMFKVGKKSAQGIAALSTALVVGAGAVNQMKLESDNMTRAMGGNIETAEAVTSAIKSIGLGAENVTDLYEEMNNKLGESAGIEEITAVTESLGILGLQFETIKKLSPDDQFKAITDAALKMEDATQAAAAADILMGGEANKIISTLRLQGKSMEDITKNYQMMNFRTDQSRRGAEAMAKAQSTTAKIIGSLTQEVSGLIGKALAPMITKFNEFMINNKELISQNLDKLFNSIGNSVGDVGQHMETLIGWIGDLGANFSEFVKWAKWVGIVTVAITGLAIAMNALIGVFTVFNLVLANPVILAVVAVVGALAAAAYLVYSNWDGIAAWFSGMWDSIKTTFNIGVQMVKSMFDWSPVEFVKAQWDGVTNYFSNLFGGIASLYESTVGAVMGKVNAAKDFFGFGDDSDTDVNRSMTIDTNNVVTPQERISRSINENRETFDINVYGQGGATVQSDNYSNRLNLINTGN
ncbi:TMhelix containing protein [Vibrio phage 1.158.O._10N.261.45.E12]|nr:TMhelix containing protein [Vibrio phage 1.158.O._10N.261.45.E12]AUR92648.1 TMhelix containing protein [Vibrio phage 1.175.O._10N.261.55.B3]